MRFDYDFNESIKQLAAMQANDAHIVERYPSGGVRYTPEYDALLKYAQDINPGCTPIGFYLTTYANTTD